MPVSDGWVRFLSAAGAVWLWVKNRVTPKWNPGKWIEGLKPAVP